jgi:CRP-like cAMP-binding protein
LFDSDATKKLPANPSEANIESKPNPCQTIFNRSEVEAVIVANTTHAVATIRTAALAAKRLIDGNGILDTPSVNGSESLSLPERMNILGKVSFFAGLPAENLAMLATLCEELRFAENDIIVREGDSDSALFVVAAGKIRLEKSGQRQDTSALISTVETGEAFGELTLLENSPRVSTALAAAPSLVLKLAPEALVALTRQHPELSVQLISVLTKRLREMEERVADRTPSKSRMLHKIYDKLD